MIIRLNDEPLSLTPEQMSELNENYKTIGMYDGVDYAVLLQEYTVTQMCVVVKNGCGSESHYFSKKPDETQMDFDLRVNEFYNTKIANAQ